MSNTGCFYLKYWTLYQGNVSKRNLYKDIASFVSWPFNAFILDTLPPSFAGLKSSAIPVYINSNYK